MLALCNDPPPGEITPAIERSKAEGPGHLEGSTSSQAGVQRVAMRMGWVATCSDESVLRRLPSEKIVDALRRGMPKAQAARTFGIGISTVKRYVAKAQKGEPLTLKPGKAPGKPPKMDERISKLLEEDLKESARLSPFGSAATT